MSTKRFFVDAPPDLQRRLRHIGIDHSIGAEKLGGHLLAYIVKLAEADPSLVEKALPRPPKK